MNKLIALLLVMSILIPAVVYSQDPATKAECVNMLKPALQAQCTNLLGSDPEKRALCIENIGAEAESQCSRFFSGNFCKVCTSECINKYQASDPTQKECLKTCRNNPACKKK